MHQYGKKKIILHIQNSVFKYICCCTQSCHYCISATLHQYQESVQLKHEHHFLTSCKNKKTAKRSHEGSLLLDNHICYWLPNCISWKWTPGGQEGAAILCCLWSLCYEHWVRGKMKRFTGVQITWTIWVWEFSSGLWVVCSVCEGGWAHEQAAKGKMLFPCFKACMSSRHWGTDITVRNIIRKKKSNLASLAHYPEEPNRWSMSVHLFLNKLPNKKLLGEINLTQ